MHAFAAGRLVEEKADHGVRDRRQASPFPVRAVLEKTKDGKFARTPPSTGLIAPRDELSGTFSSLDYEQERDRGGRDDRRGYPAVRGRHPSKTMRCCQARSTATMSSSTPRITQLRPSEGDARPAGLATERRRPPAARRPCGPGPAADPDRNGHRHHGCAGARCADGSAGLKRLEPLLGLLADVLRLEADGDRRRGDCPGRRRRRRAEPTDARRASPATRRRSRTPFAPPPSNAPATSLRDPALLPPRPADRSRERDAGIVPRAQVVLPHVWRRQPAAASLAWPAMNTDTLNRRHRDRLRDVRGRPAADPGRRCALLPRGASPNEKLAELLAGHYTVYTYDRRGAARAATPLPCTPPTARSRTSPGPDRRGRRVGRPVRHLLRRDADAGSRQPGCSGSRSWRSTSCPSWSTPAASRSRG